MKEYAKSGALVNSVQTENQQIVFDKLLHFFYELIQSGKESNRKGNQSIEANRRVIK